MTAVVSESNHERLWLAGTLILVFIILGVAGAIVGGSSIRDASEIVPLNTADIFLNNFKIALRGFIPIIGAIMTAGTSFVTGTVIKSIAEANDVNGLLVFLAVMSSPVFWLEYVAYTVASTEGVFLAVAFARRKLKAELIWAGLTVAIVAGLLLLGA